MYGEPVVAVPELLAGDGTGIMLAKWRNWDRVYCYSFFIFNRDG